ncbi:mitochondrial sodium/calcium exchanger protein [Drosophila grimshawi]|uniref:mitochondrial sodium/calcium exchanger protein n=1 Tax=Drosophila grimshawi TaxID=7222 RepID=UPI0013EEFEC6|nr:mitochondrial sodium/calcium exchanger protein [Drosophila grimshawi]
MFKLVPYSQYPINVNDSLQRARRHISFVKLWNESICYYPEQLNPNSIDLCRFVMDTPSCAYFVYYIDYLKLMFCTLDLNWHSAYMIVVVLSLLFGYSLLYMITKYFCLPNFMMLMKLLPISSYAYSFVHFGFCLFTWKYLNFWLICPYENEYKASLILSKQIGDALRYFVVGIMVLCLSGGHRVQSVLWWNNMAFIFIGFIYLLWLVRTKYQIFSERHLAYSDSHMLRFHAWALLLIFILVLLLVLVISYYNIQRRKQLGKTESAENESEMDEIDANSDLASDAEITGSAPRREDLDSFQIWWSAVNGLSHMKEPFKIIVVLFTPFYFVLAIIIPVLDEKRQMNGWCKPVVLVSLLVFPVLFIGLMPDPNTWIAVLICSWIMAFLVHISFHSLSEPNLVWLSVFCIVGTIVCSVCLHSLIREIDNLAWQYLSIRFHSIPDLICLMFLSSGEMLCAFVMLLYLKRYKLFDAAYGLVMGLVTYTIYTTLPLLTLNNCYNEQTYIMCTAHTETCYTFFMVIFLGTLFHVSMCGNEFRISLFYYLTIMYVTYVFFQLAAYIHWVYPFGSLHSIRPPKETANHWA